MVQENKYEIVELYAKAIALAREHKQIIGDKSDYYITLEQLENLMLSVHH